MNDLKNRFLKLMDEHQGIIHHISTLYSNSKEERDDISQEIILQLWRSFGSFQNQSKFSTWLYRVALNTAISHLRKSKKTPWVSLEKSTEIAVEMADDLEEEISFLYQAINNLTKIDKAIVLLYLEEYNYEEMADILGISSVNVGVKINRIKKRLKKIMVNYQTL